MNLDNKFAYKVKYEIQLNINISSSVTFVLSNLLTLEHLINTPKEGVIIQIITFTEIYFDLGGTS